MIGRISIRWLGVAALLSAFTLLAPAHSAAAVLDGPCEASGDFVDGTKADGPFTVDAKAAGSETIVIARSDTVNWSGSIDVPAVKRPYSGSISLKLPPGLGDITIDSWDGNSDRVANSGVEEYNLPSLVPAGVTFNVSGKHVEDAATCTGSVSVEVEGGVFDSPLAPISLGLTAVAGVGFIAAIRPLFRRVVS